MTKDTDSNGSIEARFGIHGESLADDPQLWLYEVETGQGSSYEELLGVVDGGRWLALKDDGRHILRDLTTGSQEDLDVGNRLAGSDGNRCLPPRELLWHDRGSQLGLLVGDPPVLLLRDLATGRQSEIRPDSGHLWRAEFLDEPGWILLYLVRAPQPGDSPQFPVYRTSCACRSCGLFAMSQSFMGWDATPFRTVLVTPDGRQTHVSGRPIPIGRTAYALQDSTLVFRLDGGRLVLPPKCVLRHVIPSVQKVLISCGEGVALFDPETMRITPVPFPVELARQGVAVADAAGEFWAPILAAEGTSPRRYQPATGGRLGRLRVSDGSIELGPVVTYSAMASSGEWVAGTSATAVYSLNLRTGELWTVAVEGAHWTDGVNVSLEGGGGLVLVPARGQYLRLTSLTSAATPTGCALRATRRPRGMAVEQGPWVRVCVRPE